MSCISNPLLRDMPPKASGLSGPARLRCFWTTARILSLFVPLSKVSDPRERPPPILLLLQDNGDIEYVKFTRLTADEMTRALVPEWTSHGSYALAEYRPAPHNPVYRRDGDE